MNIQQETKQDLNDIYNLVKTAFTTAQVSSGKEQDFTNNLRNSKNYIPQLALTAKENNNIVGFVMLTKTEVKTEEGFYDTLLLAPICVDIKFRSKGLGQQLANECFKRAVELGYTSVFLVGNPDYYKRLGFKATTCWGITNDNGIPPQYVLAKELVTDALKNIKGEIHFQTE